MAAPQSTRLQHMLQASVQAIQWTYSVFWQICPQQGVLVWGDGHYNGAIKTRKTVQPMEVSAEETCLQRSQQLRELYDSLSAGESNQPARRPCAALSPEDLTESEWFYLMCVSFSFPSGVGLPGKALATRHHVWLSGANEVDSKIFSRAILAKSARIQTIVCIPVMDGVLELGTTERVKEDLALVQRATSFFLDHQNPSMPVLSEHSTSNPVDTPERRRLHSPPLNTLFPAKEPQIQEHEAELELEPEPEPETEAEVDSDSEDDSGRESPTNAAPEDPMHLCTEMPDSFPEVAAEPSVLMQLDMSEDIRLGSPEDYSNNLDSELQLLAVSNTVAGSADPRARVADCFQADSVRTWPFLQDEISDDLAPTTGIPHVQDFTQEDAHYSHTVSMILHQNSNDPPVGYLQFSHHSAFSKWSCRNEHLLHLTLEGTSQWLLKYILFTVPFLHGKYRDENSPKSRDGDGGNRFRRGTLQDELSANHVLAERRRREKLNERFIILRSLVPFVTKMDKASILGDTIEYLKQLRRRIQDLESRNKQTEAGQRAKEVEMNKANNSKERATQPNTTTMPNYTAQNKNPILDKRKLRILEGAGPVKTKVMGGPITNVQVSIIESDALLELQCPYREGLLLEIMQTLTELLLETTTIQSYFANGVFVGEFRAKVKEDASGKKANIVEVKQAIHRIFSHS